MISTQHGVNALATLILLGAPLFAALRHRHRMRSRLKFNRQHAGKLLIASAFAVYFTITAVTALSVFGVLRLIALIPGVPDNNGHWYYLTSILTGALRAVTFIPEPPTAARTRPS